MDVERTVLFAWERRNTRYTDESNMLRIANGCNLSVEEVKKIVEKVLDESENT